MSEEHDRLESLVTRYVEGAVTIAERLEIESHLASCAECRDSLESEARTKKTMSVETKMFTEGYDAGRLEANLSHELRSGERQTRWLIALGVLSGLLTIWAFAWPPTSQPQAWSALFPLTGGFLGAILWNLRTTARIIAIAQAAQGAQRGYRELDKARVQATVRDFRVAGRFGLASALALPGLVGLVGLISRHRLTQSFPEAEIHVNSSGLLSSVVLSAGLLAGSLYCYWRARRLEKTIEA